jgi:hypothetical protein
VITLEPDVSEPLEVLARAEAAGWRIQRGEHGLSATRGPVARYARSELDLARMFSPRELRWSWQSTAR